MNHGLNEDIPANIVANVAAHFLQEHHIRGEARELVIRLSGDITCANNREAMESLVRQHCWLDFNASAHDRSRFFDEIDDRVTFVLTTPT